MNLRKDLWSEVLRELFRALAQKTIGRQSTEKDGDANKNGNNAAAIKALDKMPGADNPNPAQLKFNLPAGDSTLALAMVIAISKILKTGLAYSSFWSKLIGEFGAEFLFGVSPAATFANVIPYFGAIKREWITITGADYAYASFNTSLISLIESVEIRFTQNSTSHAWTVGTSKEQSAVANSVSYYRPLARFPMENTDHRGQIIIKDPPTWMTNSIPTTVYGPFTSGLQGNSPNDMGGQGSAQTPNNTPRPAETEKKLQGSALVQGYAEQMFKSEVLNQRRGELSGKLRFDIAPGSIVKIEAPESDIGAGTFSDALNFYAMVTQVSFAIDAETHSAGTSFAFTNLRNETENNNKNLTSDAAPIYPGTDWVGGPLVKEAMPGTTP
ncbi:hypothetical protein EBR57_09325 [bacterium]|nr:hypothetical protein [bacterium]